MRDMGKSGSPYMSPEAKQAFDEAITVMISPVVQRMSVEAVHPIISEHYGIPQSEFSAEDGIAFAIPRE